MKWLARMVICCAHRGPRDSVKCFLDLLKKKISELNIVKSSAVNPFKREPYIPFIHKMTFLHLGVKFLPEEKVNNTKNCIEYNINSIERLMIIMNNISIDIG